MGLFKLMKMWWWKVFGVLLLLVVIPAGLLIPLSPGVISVDEYRLAAGKDYRLNIFCYNTDFLDASESLQVFLRYEVEGNEQLICADEVEVISDHRLIAQIEVPASLPKREVNTFFTLIINNDIDGTFELREAFVLDLEASVWKEGGYTACEPVVKTNEASGFHFPFRSTLNETIRNLFFHVPMWFGMVLLLLFAFVSSIMFLSSQQLIWDRFAKASVTAGLLFGFLGLSTGMLWANYTWGHPWPGDAKLNGAAVGVLTYLAYVVLRGSLNDQEKRARISAVYNVFAFVVYLVFIFVLPRLTDSLHPGNGGNPAFSQYDLDNTLRLLFYPAVIGWTIMGFWIVSLLVRLDLVHEKKEVGW